MHGCNNGKLLYMVWVWQLDVTGYANELGTRANPWSFHLSQPESPLRTAETYCRNGNERNETSMPFYA